MHAPPSTARPSFRLLALTVALLVSRPASAQHALVTRPSLGAWAGASFSSPGGHFLGGETDRDLFLAGVRAEWMLGARHRLALAATMDAIPLAVVTRNP